MAGDHAYRFNHETFAFESFLDEIVVMNLVDGIYYAFGGAAIVAWPHILAQHPVPAIARALAAGYGLSADTLGADLAQFVERLLGEKVLMTAPETTSEIDPSPLRSLPEYQGFGFERHDDMEDLLTLDPIHEVDPLKGWPRT